MAIFPARALWPDRDRVPLLRLGVALAAAPGILALLLAVAVFLVMGMTEASGEAVLRETLRAAGALAVLTLVFTFTFGLAGMALLWALGWRGKGQDINDDDTEKEDEDGRSCKIRASAGTERDHTLLLLAASSGGSLPELFPLWNQFLSDEDAAPETACGR